MEVQIEHLKENGFDEIFVAINYMADYVKSFLGDGSKYGVKLSYSLENKPLGTAGPVKLLENKLDEPFLLMNGDILTKLDFNKFYNYAISFPESPLTIATKIITTPFRFGNIKSQGEFVIDVDEKPSFNFEILAGIYILKPDIFKLIPECEYFGIDHLIKKILLLKIPITKYLIKEYWLDIGVVEDYEKAREIYNNEFKA